MEENKPEVEREDPVREYLRKIGKAGGDKTKATKNPNHFREIGKLGAIKRWGVKK